MPNSNDGREQHINFLKQRIAEIENKLNKDSQMFELECKNAEIELLDRRIERTYNRIKHLCKTANLSPESKAELIAIMGELKYDYSRC